MQRARDDDPCFGSVAMRLGPRGLHVPDASFAGVDRKESVAASVRAERLESHERRALDTLARANPDRRATHPVCPSDVIVACPRAALLDLARSASFARAVLAASDNSMLPPARPRLMGVVNVTPDSFSDGGRYLDAHRAVEHALELERAGAEILDIGGESTRPGAPPVSLAEELHRVIPVVAEVARRTKAEISVDTTKAEVARQAIEAGASMINDVSAGRFDPEMLSTVARGGVRYVAMHMQGTPRDMQERPHYDDVVGDVLEFLRERAAACLRAGIPRERIAVDPGIGFGKRLEHNLELIARTHELRSLGLPVCVGVSRKSFIAAVCAESGSAAPGSTAPAAHDRIGGTAAALTVAAMGGAEIVRVHDVAVMRQALHVASALSEWNRARARAPRTGSIPAE